MERKVVAHTLDGQVHKGVTRDFDPGREYFHVLPAEGGGIPLQLQVSGLKALFYVKDFLGDKKYDPPPGFGPGKAPGRRCVVTFSDGEVIFGFTPDYVEGSAGFTLIPSDPADNNEKIFVSHGAIQHIQFPD
ncbi:MAG: hypothetical protein Q9Q40_11500 [Acidobacteriota bacterium]|nr:hypothetical protein [Acidobacteriota bacterium]MDQ7086363.1 hypothetical protein [Acidobacteriota bacterium]